MIIIGVAGGTGSGKTTVVQKIVSVLSPEIVDVIPQDAYYNDESQATPEERKNINVDHPDAFDWPLLIQQVKSLKEGRAIDMPTYSYKEFSRLPQTIHLAPKPILIVEGIMVLLDPQLRAMMNLKVFVDTDADERLIRNIRRDVVERGRTLDMVIDRYLRMKKPMHEQFIEPTKKYADLIIPQGGDNQKGIEILLSYIKNAVK